MRRRSHADRFPARGRLRRNAIDLGQHQRERTRPEARDEALAAIVPSSNHLLRLRGALDVGDERVLGRATLQPVDRLEARGIERTSTEAVNRFGGEGASTLIL